MPGWVDLAILVAVAAIAVFWLRWEIRALKTTISAQSDAIKGIEALARTSQALAEAATRVLEATDAPRMLERYKAYQELVEREKEAALREPTTRHAASPSGVLAYADAFFDLMATFLPMCPDSAAWKPSKVLA